MKVSGERNELYLLGPRSAALGGSVFNAIQNRDGGDLPALDYAEANASIKTVVAAIRARVVSAAHDISDGGLLACIAEMCLGGDADGVIGATVSSPQEWAPSIPIHAALFGEAPGFVVEVPHDQTRAFETICRDASARPVHLGTTGGSRIRVEGTSVDISLTDAASAWSTPLKALYA
jgi:phosphoribosylformylglycinamidine synthase